MAGEPQEDGFSSIWRASFDGADGSLPDESKWHIVVKGPNHDNDEVQHYIKSTKTASIQNGVLEIKPHHHDGKWTSARLESHSSFGGMDRHRVKLQAELKIGSAARDHQKGIWPAFWTLGDDLRHGVPWPTCGEWDIFENAHGDDWMLGSLHYGTPDKPQIQGSQREHFDKDHYHTWALIVDRRPDNWENETLEWHKDGKKYFSVKGSDMPDKETWVRVAHRNFFVVLNVAVGTNFPGGGGKPDEQTVAGLQSGLQVKYVGFYEWKPN
jgi:beta-glucanase (GH16 family)